MKIIIGSDVSTEHNRASVDRGFCRTLLSEVKPILEDADFRLVNLESVLCAEDAGTPIVKSGPNLRGERKNIAFLTEGGFDCAVLANNHFGDYSEGGILSTLSVLRENGIAPLGGGMNKEEAYRAWYAVKDGVSVAFLAVCENEFGTAGEDTPGSAGFDEKRLFERIREEKAKNDFVIVIFHGGNENNPIPSPYTIDRYRLLTEFGADALIAMHTHCMQGFETYRGKPIVYSMGNFFFDYPNTAPDAPWFYGYLSELTVEKGKPITFRPIPYALRDGGTRLEVFEGEKKEKILAHLEKISAIIQKPDEVRRYFDAWCVISGFGYAKRGLVYTPDYENDELTVEQQKSLAQTRNLFWCEAHRDLMKWMTAMELSGRTAKARADVDELKALRKMPF